MTLLNPHRPGVRLAMVLVAALASPAVTRAQEEGEPLPEAPGAQWPEGLLPAPDKETPKVGFHAYTRGHAKNPNPPDLLGGPLKITVRQAKGEGTRLVLPGPRYLDPAVFGTPENPLGFDPAPFPLMGVPVELRRHEDGAYTFVNHPTPFSDWRIVGTGSVDMELVDATAIDGARTKDKIHIEANFHLPGPDPNNPDNGKTRWRVVSKKPLPHGFGFPTFGGVASNHLLHGVTGLGTRLMPTEWTYVDTWGKGDIYKNGKLVAEDHMIHTMVTEVVRGEGYRLLFDGEVGQRPGKTLHLMIPPYKPTEEGMKKSPLKTMFVPFPYIKQEIAEDREEAKALPAGEREKRLDQIDQIEDLMDWTQEKVVEEVIEGNMAGMPFIHIMFGNVEVQAER